MEIDDGVYAGVFVVAQVKKTLLHKTMFHLCALDNDRFWVRLKRNKKGGVAFRPLRRVVKVTFEVSEKATKKSTTTGASSPRRQQVSVGDMEEEPQLPSAPSPRGRFGGSSPVVPPEEGSPIDPETAQYMLILNDFGADSEKCT